MKKPNEVYRVGENEPTVCFYCDQPRSVLTYDQTGLVTDCRCRVCKARHEAAEYRRTRVLTTQVLMSSVHARCDRKIYDLTLDRLLLLAAEVSEMDRMGVPLASDQATADEDFRLLVELLQADFTLQQLTKRFEEEVWFAGLQAVTMESRQKGMSFKTDGFELLSFSMCGRTMLTLQRPDRTQVTLITEEDSNLRRMGWQSICATLSEAVSLIDDAIRLHHEGYDPINDDKVKLLGM